MNNKADSLISEDGNLNENTIRFCGDCRNILNPSVEEENLIYSCDKRNCDYKMVIKGKG